MHPCGTVARRATPRRARARLRAERDGVPVFALAALWQVKVLVRSSYGKLYAVGQASLKTWLLAGQARRPARVQLWQAPAGDQLGQPQQLSLAPWL